MTTTQLAICPSCGRRYHHGQGLVCPVCADQDDQPPTPVQPTSLAEVGVRVPTCTHTCACTSDQECPHYHCPCGGTP